MNKKLAKAKRQLALEKACNHKQYREIFRPPVAYKTPPAPEVHCYSYVDRYDNTLIIQAETSSNSAIILRDKVACNITLNPNALSYLIGALPERIATVLTKKITEQLHEQIKHSVTQELKKHCPSDTQENPA